MLCDTFMYSFTLVLIWDRVFRFNQFCRRAVGNMNRLGQINGFLARPETCPVD